MRPARVFLALSSCFLIVLLLSYIASRRSSHGAGSSSRRIRALFDWRSPSSLFPPSAIISLTDDNSTFFLARPANFGPVLPAEGLSGPLWIGSGFGDESITQGGIASAEGELGCSDVPGWDEGERGSPSARHGDSADKKGRGQTSDNNKDPQQRSALLKRRNAGESPQKHAKSTNPSEVDGTDDHLHHPLPSSHDLKAKTASGKKLGHADIQSIQESAEIAGKIVLLSRGGCGFLEKVKWVQRRGGTALIVGDNIRGGMLVTMYAHGDTSNVTIPSLFTSHTTAHLLSSLMPSGGGRRDDGSLGNVRRPGLALGPDGDLQTESSPKKQVHSANDLPGPGKAVRPQAKVAETADRGSWLRSFFAGSVTSPDGRESRRPPSSGSVDWILQDDFREDGKARPGSTDRRLSGSKGSGSTKESASVPSKKVPTDGFVIGVHDWRDPDLVEIIKEEAGKAGDEAAAVKDKKVIESSTSKTGSIHPGSGAYTGKGDTRAQSGVKDGSRSKAPDRVLKASVPDSAREHESLTKNPPRAGEGIKEQVPKEKDRILGLKEPSLIPHTVKNEGRKVHDGLWVTLQPTNMSTSPFFDTLLVLVVSPLVTLSVVYALLLLRSRIRRRRWRAPKSVVERLPVRTYHTIPSSSATTSSAQITPPGTPPLPDQTTPLLHSCARPIAQRQRSRTTGELPVASSSYANRNEGELSLDQIQEKREAGLMEWRRKYGGRQRECVVCLEEYVDGVSQVMSLPCGHEFHAECM